MSNDYPIVLSHGIARFDFLSDYINHTLERFGLDFSTLTDQNNYFKGISNFLTSKGFNVHHTRVSFAAGVDRRSNDLRDQINNILALTGKEKVHIIGHSMGGLDTRHMIVEKGMAERVASLTTIGTPHNGTSFATWGIENGGTDTIKVVSKVINIEGFNDLTIDSCRRFNEAARNSEASNNVVYKTYGAVEEYGAIFWPLKPSYKIIEEHGEGPNDGLVPLTSQHWQKELKADDGRVKDIEQIDFPVPADHLNECGWWDLDELAQTPFFSLNFIRAAHDFEQQIKNVYLKIATEAAKL